MGAVSSESLGHPCRCRFLHHRNLDSRGSGYVLRLVRDSAEDPPGPYLDTHTKPGPSLHETSSARPCRVRRQLSPRLLAPHHRPRFEIHNGGVSSKAKYEMRDGPLVSGVQAPVANRLERPWSRARVVSVKEKARQTCQVGVGKTSANEPMMKRFAIEPIAAVEDLLVGPAIPLADEMGAGRNGPCGSTRAWCLVRHGGQNTPGCGRKPAMSPALVFVRQNTAQENARERAWRS